MNEKIVWVELALLPIAKMQDVILARFIGRDEAAKLGFAPAMLTRIATAISEITRNVVQHADCPGAMRIGHGREGERRGMRIIVSDKGKGIQHPKLHLEEGKVGALGSGLSSIRRLVDQFDLQSSPGSGTTVTMEIWNNEATT
jgi:serine/threonine-protein kinase RsbT